MAASAYLETVWMKAAMLGSLWASIEIVLGSFLHNARIPFAGTVLSALGVCLIVAGSQIWNQKGMIWRAGVICALMKSVSPSAVIIGPMVGITLEALFLDATTRFLGRNTAGFLIGGALATSLPIVQEIAGILVMYGPDAARLYVAVYDLAARTLRVQSFGALDLILAWFSLNLMLGSAAAFIGMQAGKRAHALPDPPVVHSGDASAYSLGEPDPSQRFSLLLLAVQVALLPLAFIAVRDLPLGLSALVVALYFVLYLILYPRIRQRFRHPRIWIEFIVVSVLSGLLLGGLAQNSNGWSWDGFAIGLQMALRATLVIVAFSGISIELRNPVVVQWALRRGLGQLTAALDVAFQALPAMVQAIGEEKRFFHEPLNSVARILAGARGWLAQRIAESGARIFILTGGQGSGKTSFLLQLTSLLAERNVSTGGILAPVVLQDGKRLGYDVRDIASSEQVPLCRADMAPAELYAGPFQFLDRGIAFGENSLAAATAARKAVVVIDEIGPLELSGKGWSDSVQRILVEAGSVVILVVRTALVDQVTGHWQITPETIWEAGKTTLDEAAGVILRLRAS
jgi:nucleoside-triphosphatase THEP1